MLIILCSTLFAGIVIGSYLPGQTEKRQAILKKKQAKTGWFDTALYIVDKYED